MRLFNVATVVVIGCLAAAGCKNSSTGQFSNPFLTPDRVPPPSTRVLAPGTAQPYYPGDPMPGTAPAAAPALGAPGATTPPLTTPPGGWGASPPQSSGHDSAAMLAGDAVGVPRDGEALRFAGPDAVGPQQLASREITQAEFLAGSGPASFANVRPASATLGGDGFRPQGSQPPVTIDRGQSFRPPEFDGSAPRATQASTASYAAGPNHEWLRGQLEYWPVTGEWSLRYLPEGGPADDMGGRVMIENPQVLANLQPGELVAVQGQLFGRLSETGAATPAYRVAAVQRQRP